MATFALHNWPTDIAMTATACADGRCRDFWIKTPITAGDPICTPVDPDDVDDSCKLDEHGVLEIGIVFSATQVVTLSSPFYPNGEACDARVGNWCQGGLASFDISQQ